MGGLADGARGIAAMEYIRDGLRAKKAWFFLDQAVVCLGAGVDGKGPEAVLTSVNQCALNGPVTIGTDQPPRELEKGRHSLDELKWVHHDGMGYVFPEPVAATVCAQPQSGNWRTVHSRESARMMERDVFSLWIDHGSQPQGARYAYIVFPDAAAAAMPSLHHASPVTILQQTPSILAVASSSGKLLQAVFFEPGRLNWGSGRSLEVESPCLVTLDDVADTMRLHVADPTHTHKAVTLRLAGRYLGPEARYNKSQDQTELTIPLPQEGSAGRTVSLELRPGKPYE